MHSWTRTGMRTCPPIRTCMRMHMRTCTSTSRCSWPHPHPHPPAHIHLHTHARTLTLLCPLFLSLAVASQTSDTESSTTSWREPKQWSHQILSSLHSPMSRRHLTSLRPCCTASKGQCESCKNYCSRNGLEDQNSNVSDCTAHESKEIELNQSGSNHHRIGDSF